MPQVEFDKKEFMKHLLSKVLKKGADNRVVTEEFDVGKIIASLQRETSAPLEAIKLIAKYCVQMLAKLNLPILTAPMIREIVCTVMLDHGYMQYRAEYTRIGFPYHDLKQILQQPDRDQRIVDHIVYEFNAVKDLLDEYETKHDEVNPPADAPGNAPGNAPADAPPGKKTRNP